MTSDITELAMLRDYLSQVLDVFSDGVCVTDAQGKVLFLNAMHEAMTGVQHDSMIGHDVHEFTSKGVFDVVLNPEVFRTGKMITRVQTLSNGRRLVLEGHPIFDSHHNVVFCVTLLRDESSLQELQSRLLFQKEMLDVFSKLSNSPQNSAFTQMPEIVQSSVMTRLRNKVSVIAKTDAPVLILGETGVGKDVLARRIHTESGRAENAFIKVDCGSISPQLIETELFGYVGGTFSGANRNGKVGLIEAANNGTMFLDEIGELPIAMQTRLLRFLQDGEVLRVGATTPKRLDVRIIAATNKDLEKAIANGEFRSDLYYRLKIAVLTIPPLRERRDDFFPWRISFWIFLRTSTDANWNFLLKRKKLCKIMPGRAMCGSSKTWCRGLPSPVRTASFILRSCRWEIRWPRAEGRKAERSLPSTSTGAAIRKS